MYFFNPRISMHIILLGFNFHKHGLAWRYGCLIAKLTHISHPFITALPPPVPIWKMTKWELTYKAPIPSTALAGGNVIVLYLLRTDTVIGFACFALKRQHSKTGMWFTMAKPYD